MPKKSLLIALGSTGQRMVDGVEAVKSESRRRAKMPTTDTSIQSSLAERIVGGRKLTSAEVVERCEKIVAALRAVLGEKLVAVALYGSWARGDADEDSDVDLLVIADELPDHPIQRVRFLKRMAGSEAGGVQFYARTRKGFESYFGVMYLEFGLDAQVLYDPTGYLAAKLAHIRDIINEAGLYRVQKGRDLFWRWKNPPPACKWKLSWEGYDDGSGRTSFLQVAEELLNEAEQDAASGRWATCVRHAQLTTELSAKGAIECWEPALRTHDLTQVIDDILATRTLEPDVRNAMEELKVCSLRLDYDVHIKASYGDEDAHLTPSQLFHEADATDALDCARKAVSLARFVITEMSKP